MGTRTLLLVRHGQYTPDDKGQLTEIGREQAHVTGKWIDEHLHQSRTRVDALWSSTLPRARETAQIVGKQLTPRSLSAANAKPRAVGVLREGMYTKVKGYDIPLEERNADRKRADDAWSRFFRTSRLDCLEIVVCHGNLIRYFVCRALHVSVARWTRMNSNHCSMTRILIRDTGAIRVVTYNETSHLPAKLVT